MLSWREQRKGVGGKGRESERRRNGGREERERDPHHLYHLEESTAVLVYTGSRDKHTN